MSEYDDIQSQLKAWAGFVSSGYEVPAAGGTMSAAAAAIKALAGEVERWEKNHEALQDKIDCMKSCGCAYDAAGDICGHHSPKLLAAEAERDRMKAALQRIASQKSFAELEAGTEDDDVDYDLIGAWDIVIGVARKALGGAS